MQILTSLQEEVLRIFAETQEAELFYLTGGTALAGFYLQHRFSKDLDLSNGVHKDNRRQETEMEKLRLPVVKGRIPKSKRLSMDDYLKFVYLNLKYTVDRKADRESKRQAAVNVPFLL